MYSLLIQCCILSSHLTGSRMHSISPPSFLQLHTPDIYIIQRQRSYEEELGNALNLCLNHIKTALCNFLNDLTRAAPAETDRALCPNIEHCPPNGRKSKHFIFATVILALYCQVNIIIALRKFFLGHRKAIVHQFVLSSDCCGKSDRNN